MIRKVTVNWEQFNAAHSHRDYRLDARVKLDKERTRYITE